MKHAMKLALLAVLAFPALALSQEWHGLAVTRLESGQTWYAAAALTVDRPYQGEWMWSLRTRPEPDFWARDIDLMETELHKRTTRTVDVSYENGTVTIALSGWGAIRFAPMENAEALSGYATGQRERAALVVRDRDNGTVGVFVAHRIWGAIF